VIVFVIIAIIILNLLVLLYIAQHSEPPEFDFDIFDHEKRVPIDHTIERAEDLFTPFNYSDGQTFTFLMTLNVTELTITTQHGDEENYIISRSKIEMDNNVNVTNYQSNYLGDFAHIIYKVSNLEYNQYYNLTFLNIDGVAWAEF
jgi:hypothetical protein